MSTHDEILRSQGLRFDPGLPGYPGFWFDPRHWSGDTWPSVQMTQAALVKNNEIIGVKPQIVCLCGSTRFWRTFQKASLDETLAGRIVLSIGAASGTDDDHFGNLPREEYDRVKAMLDDLHLRKIDLADEVLILNVDGYIGESTRREWLYAVTSGKRVRWLEPHNIPSFVDTKIVSEGFTRCPECGHEMDQNTIGEWVCLTCEARRD